MILIPRFLGYVDCVAKTRVVIQPMKIVSIANLVVSPDVGLTGSPFLVDEVPIISLEARSSYPPLSLIASV